MADGVNSFVKRKKSHAKHPKQKADVKHDAEPTPQIARRKDIRRWMTPLWIISGVLLALAGILCSVSLSHFKYAALWIAFIGTVFATAAVFVWLHATIAEHDKDSTPPKSVANKSPSPLETPRVSNIASPSHKITENAFEIISKINNAGPLQKEDVINSYINGSIDWKVGFHSIRAIKGDSEHIEAIFTAVANRAENHPSIVCVVSRREYAYLDKFKFPGPMPVFRITGIVTDIEPEGASIIKIDNAVATQLDSIEQTTARLNPNLMPTPLPMNETKITSHNQSGGFTGINQGTINVSPASRTIPPDSRIRLVSGLKKAPNSFVGIDTPMGDTEAQNFAEELRKAFEDAGWKVAVAQANWGPQTPTGLHLAFNNPRNVPAHAAILQEALLDAGFLAVADVVDPTTNEHTVRLIVGTKPTTP